MYTVRWERRIDCKSKQQFSIAWPISRLSVDVPDSILHKPIATEDLLLPHGDDVRGISPFLPLSCVYIYIYIRRPYRSLNELGELVAGFERFALSRARSGSKQWCTVTACGRKFKSNAELISFKEDLIPFNMDALLY